MAEFCSLPLVQEVDSKILPIRRVFSPPHISRSFVFNKLLSPSCVRGIIVGLEVSDIPMHIIQPKGRKQTITELWDRGAEDIVGVETRAICHSLDSVVRGQKVFWSRWLELSF